MAYYPPSVGGYQPPQMQMMPQGNTYLPMSQNAPTAQQGFTVRPVASREEAMAIPSEFFGPGILMPCLGQGRIWLKKFDSNTGQSQIYEFLITNKENDCVTEYATKEDLYLLRTEIKDYVKGVFSNSE